MRIVLASASPRRKELLGQLGIEFEICISDVEENIKETMPARMVEELSFRKAEAVFHKLTGDILVIGADTVVALEDKILGKPESPRHAKEMLKSLQAREHHVYTGVTIYKRQNGKEFHSIFSESTLVKFYPMTDAEIQWYVDSLEPLDKAGAYGIQGLGARYVEKIIGDYNNVVGLPIARLYQELKYYY